MKMGAAMPDDPRVDQLLEELLDSGGTPEQVCRTCPELLPQVRAGWERLCALRAEIGALFPETSLAGDATPQPLSTRELPSIRGYEVQEVLGHGGMGIVYKAWHQRLQRPIAIKMLLAGGYAHPQELERFLREAETVAGLRHANIVQVHEAGEVDGRPYFAMEFIEGGSLAESLAGMPLPARQAAALTARVAEAVHAAHQRGIVHRDLKPANILLTADGTPKITDFGLARRLERATGLTQSGAPLGTPSYMAPEQAEGKSRTVGPAADTYAVGAILYELLTGRPPFRADSAAETLRQVIAHDPVPPCRLNAAVPRNLQTICLKCLEKDPLRRYSSAQALAQDLHRFERNEPIVARPAGALERMVRWTQRKPTAAALVATALALVGLASGGSVWLVQQQAQRRTELHGEVGTAVAQSESLRKQFHFHEARQLLEQARQQLEPAGPDDLRRQVEQVQADLELATNLDAARLRAATPAQGRFKTAGAGSPYAESLYEETLAKARLNLQGEVGEAAARVRDSALRTELVAALDDWASITPDPARRAWLLAVARAADPDPSRDRLRQPALWDDGPELAKRVNELPADELSVQLTTALGRVLLKAGGDAVPLLRAAQARYPQDFWLNFELGWALYESGRSDEALGFYRAALALRPGAAPAYNGVALTLAVLGRRDEAIDYYHQALKIDPNFAMAHNNLGLALWAEGRQDEAIGHYQEAIRLDPKASATAHNNLGLALWAEGRQDEAIRHYREAIRLDPKASATAHNNLGEALRAKGRLDEAIGHYREAIRLDPNLAVAHNNLGLALWAKGRQDEAIGHYQEAIRLDPKASATAHVNLGEALRAKGRLDEAIGHYLEAVRLDPNLAEARHNLFLGRYAAASAAVRASVGQGSQEKRPGEAERVGLRRRALDWLRADLELRAEQLKDSKAVDWSYLSRWPLSAWQTDPALAGVRDRAALATLPDAEREQWQRLWADVAALVGADLLEQGRAHAARRDWDQAADCYARALKRGATDEGHFWFEYAAVLLLSGDQPGYAKACAHMLERCGKAPDLRAYHVARACTLAPNAVADASLPGRLAETELKARAGQFWSLTERGALQYRAGRFPEAIALFEQSLRADATPGRAVVNWLWLALAQQRLGRQEEARRWLDKATTWLDQYPDGMPARAEQELGLHLHNWLEAHVLRRETEALIRTPAVPSPP
jgi:serine/threonine-protein kinase